MKNLNEWIDMADTRTANERAEGASPKWATVMRAAWYFDGARKFGKVLALPTIIKAGEVIQQGEVRSEVLPLLYPEAPPEGLEYHLVWNNGASWNSPSLVRCYPGDYGAEDPEYLESLLKSAKVMQRILAEEKSADIRTMIDRAIEQFPEMSDLMESPESFELIKMAFSYGAAFGRWDSLEKMKPILDLHQDRDRTSDWAEVARAALEVYPGLSAKQLLAKMGGVKRERRIPDGLGGYTLDGCEWCFPTGITVDEKAFQKGANAAKTG
jgi:hypothetical protein